MFNLSIRKLQLVSILVSGLIFFVLITERSIAAKADYSHSGIIEKINQQRVLYNQPALTIDTRLDSAAMEKAKHLIEADYFDHYSPDGVSPWDFILASGFDYLYAGENLAINYRDAGEVTEAWMGSGSHRKNLLNGGFDSVGVGIAEGDINGKFSTVTVLMLGTERGVRTSLFNLPLAEIIRILLGGK